MADNAPLNECPQFACGGLFLCSFDKCSWNIAHLTLQYKSIINQSICDSVYAKLKTIYVVRFWGEEQNKNEKM